jgi:hypothetical protein
LTYSFLFDIVVAMKRRDIVIGLAILLVIVGLFYFRQREENGDLTVPEEETVQDVERRIEERFGVQIPEGVNRTQLRDVAGGDAYGLATRTMENKTFVHNILADLPDPETGRVYQAWLARGEEGEEDYDLVATGRMRIAKGGWVLEYRTSRNLEDYNRVLISSERAGEQSGENLVLEGSF